MADMQEKVARAIARICNDKGQELASKCEMQAPPIPWQAFEREAKAAIEAHEQALEEQGLVIVPREPTDEMVKAAARLLVEATKEYSLEPDVDDVTDALVSRMLQKAADAALEGDE